MQQNGWLHRRAVHGRRDRSLHSGSASWPGLYTKVVNARDTVRLTRSGRRIRPPDTTNDGMTAHRITSFRRAGDCDLHGTAAILALAVSTQTYLSMLGHGHAFPPHLHLATELVELLGIRRAAVVLRRGAAAPPAAGRIACSSPRPDRLALMAAHVAIASQLAAWLQPFMPVETYSFTGALVRQARRISPSIRSPTSCSCRRRRAGGVDARSAARAARIAAGGRAHPRAAHALRLERATLPLQHAECDRGADPAEGQPPRV